MRFDREFLQDAAERVVATYVVAFLGLLIASPSLDIDAAKAAAIAALPAALTVIKTLIAKQVGDPETAALLPAGKVQPKEPTTEHEVGE